MIAEYLLDPIGTAVLLLIIAVLIWSDPRVVRRLRGFGDTLIPDPNVSDHLRESAKSADETDGRKAE